MDDTDRRILLSRISANFLNLLPFGHDLSEQDSLIENQIGDLCKVGYDLAHIFEADFILVTVCTTDPLEERVIISFPESELIFGNRFNPFININESNFLFLSDFQNSSFCHEKILLQGRLAKIKSMAITPFNNGEFNGMVYIGWLNAIDQFEPKNLISQLIIYLAASFYINHYLISISKMQATQIAVWQETSEKVLPLLKSSRITRQQIIELIAKVYGYRYVSLWLVDVIHNDLYADSQIGFPASASTSRVEIGKGGVVGNAAANDKPIIVPDVSICDFYIESSSSVKSELAIPLLFENKVFAVFDLQSERINDFDEYTVRFMVALAGQITTTINNVIVYEQMKEQEARLNAILEGITEPILALGPDGQIIHANSSFKNLYDIADTNLIGKYIKDIVNFKDHDFITIIDHALSSGGSVSNYSIIEKSGRMFKVLVNIPFFASKSIGVVVLLHDVTYETELDRMKTDLISHVSHDLRTPLTSLVGFASTSLRDLNRYILPAIDKDNIKAQEVIVRIMRDIEIMKEEGNRLSELITNWLDIQKIEAGQFNWDLSEVSLSHISKNAIDKMHGMASQKGIFLRLDVINDISVLADENGLMRVLINLISNAIKYSDKGTITLRIKSSDQLNISSTNNRLTKEFGIVEVEDNGEGIPEAGLPLLFEKFQQIKSPNSKTQKGTGLGLAICKEIIQAHNGTIWVESQVGIGTKFSFAIPIFQSEEKDKLVIINEYASPDNKKEYNETRVLVVDDDNNIRRFIVSALRDLNCNFFEAGDGIAAIRLAKELLPDVIILDINMEPLSGLDVLRELKREKTTAKLPVLILTVQDLDRKFRDIAIELGATAFLQKPIDSSQIESAVKELIPKKI